MRHLLIAVFLSTVALAPAHADEASSPAAPEKVGANQMLVYGAGDAVVTVGDRGPGLTEEECTNVFEPFVRGRSRRGAGHGLGLAIARRAVHAHRGTIVAAPREGGGLLVTLRVPALA